MEKIGSVSLTRSSNFEEGSSSSQNHVNNLEEEQRLMMFRSRYHRTVQAMPHPPVYPPGSRFLPTDLGCVRVHLRNKVEKNKSGFITTLDLYKDDPWLLDHVQNDLFPRGEWYYFTPRNKRGSSSCNRTVRGRGGGTWRSTSGKEAIFDKDDKVQGYKQSLVYNKTNVNGKIKPTGWNMTEYCLHEENQDDLVLCHVKGDIKKKGFTEEVKENNILSDQVQNPEEEEAGANGVEMRRTLQEDHQQQQQQEQDTLSVVSVPPPHDGGQGLGVETTQNNDHDLMLQEDHGDATQQQQQHPQEQDGPPVLFIPPDEYRNSEHLMTMQNNLMTTLLQLNHGEQQQQQEQDAPPVLVPPPPHEGRDSGFERMINNDNNFMTTMMLQEDHGDATLKQQLQEKVAPAVLVRPPHEGQDAVLEEMMNDENNFMPRWDEGQQYQFDDLDLYIDVDDLFNFPDLQENDGLVGRV
ncbi:hypothetical protein Bca52824_050189 [Brassica carinata]|uniref:NAC domain-containing protein n=1 Tax=Brassica carinata TaxID=52824 RepID=A0A8X7RLX8_BRACI|nr:hypothetical protein Bca52824_050189 [Brassica carinata]